MEYWNKSELIHHMSRLGCFDAQNAETSICKKLLDLLIPKNESSKSDNSGRVNDDYSVVNRVAIASYSLAIFLNCALLWIMYKDPLKRFRTPSALLLANLAISDLFGACFSLAIECEFSQNPRYATSVLTTHYLPWLVATTAQSSYYTVMLVSFERYTAIAHPFRYRVLIITKYTVIAMVISWLLAFAISTPLFFGQDIHKITYTGNPIYAIYTFILIATILVLYPLTHSSLRRQRKQVLTMNASNTKLRRNKMKIEKNFANTMFLVCLSLILFTSPYVVVFFFTTTECNSCILNNYFLHIWTYFRIVFAMHFGVNPVIYAWRLPCYRDSLLNLLPVMKNRVGRALRRNHPTQMNTVRRSGASRQNESSIQGETRT